MPVNDFLNHASERGINFSHEIIRDGQLHRVHVEGDKRGKKNGWYTFYDDVIPVCVYGSWKMGEKFVWSARHESELSAKEKAALTLKMKTAQREAQRLRNIEQMAAAVKAGEAYSSGTIATGHAYLTSKGIGTSELLMVANDNVIIEGNEKDIDISGCLMIPVIDQCGQLTSVQYIYGNGRKMFHPNGKIKGCFTVIYGDESKVYVCEGYATGASINEATGATVYVSFNCGNMEGVAKFVKQYHKHSNVILAGDDDWQTMRPIKNPGKHHCGFTSSVLKIPAVYPEFKSDRAIDDTDFNDMHKRYGINSLIDLLA